MCLLRPHQAVRISHHGYQASAHSRCQILIAVQYLKARVLLTQWTHRVMGLIG